MNLLRDLRASTRLLFLYEVTTSHHTRLRTIADRLGMTVQGASEYAHGLQRDGLFAFVNGEYRATKKGVELLHDGFLELQRFVERAGRSMAFVEATAALAGNSMGRGDRVGLFMEGGVLVAYARRASPSMGLAVHDAEKGGLVSVQGLEGIVALRPGRILLVRIPARGAKKSLSSLALNRLLRNSKESIVAALDVTGLAAARELGVRPRIEFGVVPATLEAAQRGVDVLLLLPEERVAETVRAIEETNAKLEDKIRYETVSL
jgi:putative transcriptional regulator